MLLYSRNLTCHPGFETTRVRAWVSGRLRPRAWVGSHNFQFDLGRQSTADPPSAAPRRHAPTGATRTLEPLSRRSTSRCTVGGVTFSRGLYFLFFTLSRITCAGTADRPCPVSLSPVLSSPPTPQFATERVCNKHLTSHLLLLQLLLLLCCYCRCSCCCAAAAAAPATQSHFHVSRRRDEP